MSTEIIFFSNPRTSTKHKYLFQCLHFQEPANWTQNGTKITNLSHIQSDKKQKLVMTLLLYDSSAPILAFLSGVFSVTVECIAYCLQPIDNKIFFSILQRKLMNSMEEKSQLCIKYCAYTQSTRISLNISPDSIDFQKIFGLLTISVEKITAMFLISSTHTNNEK